MLMREGGTRFGWGLRGVRMLLGSNSAHVGCGILGDEMENNDEGELDR